MTDAHEFFGERMMDTVFIGGAIQKMGDVEDGFTPDEALAFMERFWGWLMEQGLGFGGSFGRGDDWPYPDEQPREEA